MHFGFQILTQRFFVQNLLLCSLNEFFNSITPFGISYESVFDFQLFFVFAPFINNFFVIDYFFDVSSKGIYFQYNSVAFNPIKFRNQFYRFLILIRICFNNLICDRNCKKNIFIFCLLFYKKFPFLFLQYLQEFRLVW